MVLFCGQVSDVTLAATFPRQSPAALSQAVPLVTFHDPRAASQPCPVLLKLCVLQPQPFLLAELAMAVGEAQRNLVCLQSASNSKTRHKHIGVPRGGSVEPCEIRLQPSPVGALCFQSTPHCAGDVTNRSEPPGKVRPVG